MFRCDRSSMAYSEDLTLALVFEEDVHIARLL